MERIEQFILAQERPEECWDAHAEIVNAVPAGFEVMREIDRHEKRDPTVKLCPFCVSPSELKGF